VQCGLRSGNIECIRIGFWKLSLQMSHCKLRRRRRDNIKFNTIQYDYRDGKRGGENVTFFVFTP